MILSLERGEQGELKFTVRITARSARARLDGDVVAELDEARLLKLVVAPYREGLPIALGGRRLDPDDIAAVKIVKLDEAAEDVTDRYLEATERPEEGRSAESHDARAQESEIPSRLTVLVGGLTLAGLVITFAAAPAWLAAAGIGAALSTCGLHRWVWRPHPSGWGVIAVVAVTLVAAVGAHLLLESGSARRAASDAPATRTPVSEGGVGQIEAGNIARASASGTFGTYDDPFVARSGSTVTVAIRLSNVGPDDLLGTRVKASLPDGAASALSIDLVARPRNANPPSVSDTATIEVEGGVSSCVAYVPESARLYDQHFGLIRDLPDGIVEDGVPTGPLGVPIEDTRFVSFDVQLRPAGGECG